MAEAITDRISLTDDAVRAVTIGQVLAQYFVLDTEPVLQLGPVAVTAGQLLLFGLAVGAVSVVIALRRGVAAQLVPLGVVWLLSLVDGAFQGARRHTYPSCADAVALCLCAGQLYAAASAGCTAYPGEEKRSCGIPLNITGPSTTIKCW